jgi:phage/plasmid-associated DNA primase
MNKHIPNTFKADIDVARKFPAWRPCVLDWAMEGLQMYYREGFNDIPPECNHFKRLLQKEHDTVRDFVEGYLDIQTPEGGNPPYVTLKQLYRKFEWAFKDTQRDRKTKLTQEAFKKALMKHIGEGRFKEKHQPCETVGNQKVRKCIRSVFLGVTLEDEGGYGFQEDM